MHMEHCSPGGRSWICPLFSQERWRLLSEMWPGVWWTILAAIWQPQGWREWGEAGLVWPDSISVLQTHSEDSSEYNIRQSGILDDVPYAHTMLAFISFVLEAVCTTVGEPGFKSWLWPLLKVAGFHLLIWTSQVTQAFLNLSVLLGTWGVMILEPITQICGEEKWDGLVEPCMFKHLINISIITSLVCLVEFFSVLSKIKICNLKPKVSMLRDHTSFWGSYLPVGFVGKHHFISSGLALRRYLLIIHPSIYLDLF